ncbi:MAG: C_GCAxxG_C_C family protein [Clostridia bacterium]|nr:C_GCAxxG_C_C family protein [Clostridia bacterium]
MNKKEYAAELHSRGCNCAQSVFCAFADECGMSEDVMMKIAEGFGLGCGGMEGVCGALSGALMVAGMKHADGNIEAPKSKKTTYGVAKKMCADFKAKCGSLICAQLKGIESSKPLMPCPACIDTGIEIAEAMLGGKYDND